MKVGDIVDIKGTKFGPKRVESIWYATSLKDFIDVAMSGKVTVSCCGMTVQYPVTRASVLCSTNPVIS